MLFLYFPKSIAQQESIDNMRVGFYHWALPFYDTIETAAIMEQKKLCVLYIHAHASDNV